MTVVHAVARVGDPAQCRQRSADRQPAGIGGFLHERVLAAILAADDCPGECIFLEMDR